MNNTDTIVIVIEDGTTHTYRTPRKVNDEIERLISDPKAGVDAMLAEFESEFSISEPPVAEPANITKGKRKKLEPVSLRAYDRNNYRLK